MPWKYSALRVAARRPGGWSRPEIGLQQLPAPDPESTGRHAQVATMALQTSDQVLLEQRIEQMPGDSSISGRTRSSCFWVRTADRRCCDRHHLGLLSVAARATWSASHRWHPRSDAGGNSCRSVVRHVDRMLVLGRACETYGEEAMPKDPMQAGGRTKAEFCPHSVAVDEGFRVSTRMVVSC